MRFLSFTWCAAQASRAQICPRLSNRACCCAEVSSKGKEPALSPLPPRDKKSTHQRVSDTVNKQALTARVSSADGSKQDTHSSHRNRELNKPNIAKSFMESISKTNPVSSESQEKSVRPKAREHVNDMACSTELNAPCLERKKEAIMPKRDKAFIDSVRPSENKAHRVEKLDKQKFEQPVIASASASDPKAVVHPGTCFSTTLICFLLWSF